MKSKDMTSRFSLLVLLCGVFSGALASPSVYAKEIPPSGKKQSEIDESAKNVTWSWQEDTLAGQIITFVKDKVGNVYQLLPAGPQLPFGSSKAAMESQAKRYGYRMIPLNNKTGEKLIISPFETIKQRADRLKQSKLIGNRLNSGWEVIKLGRNIYEAYTGEDNVKHAQNKIIAGTVAAEIGIALGHAANALSLTPGVGLGVGLLSATSGELVKTAFMDGLEAWDAEVESIAAEQNWKQGELENTRKLIQRVQFSLKAGKFDEAVKWNQKLFNFTVERQFSNADLTKLNTLSWDLQKKIYLIRAQASRDEVLDEDKKLAEIRRKEILMREEWTRQEQVRLVQEAKFNIQMNTSNTNLKPGEKVEVAITLNGGIPPYIISGDYQANLQQPRDTFSFTAPSAPGLYEIVITVVDKQGWERQTTITFLVGEDNLQDGDQNNSAPKNETTIIDDNSQENTFDNGSINPDVCDVSEEVRNAMTDRIAQDSPSHMASLAKRLFNENTKEQVMNCICRVHSGKTSSVSVWYQTTPYDGSDSCNDVSNGACVGQGFGCSRSPFKPDKEALENCGVAQIIATAMCKSKVGG